MKALNRLQLGNPILRYKAKPVPISYIKTAAFKKLVKDMIFTMRVADGVGLAAPQIGKSLRIAVLEMRPTKKRPRQRSKSVLVIINPKILFYSKSKNSSWEGCLSMPGFWGMVPRSKTIKVSYINLNGEKIVETVNGMWARIFQHEIDHLDGKIYIDRIEDTRKTMVESEFMKRVVKKRK